MKKVIFFLFAVCFSVSAAYSQAEYQDAVGIRLGTGYYDLISADYKHMFGESHHGVELNFGFRPSYSSYNVFSLSLAATYEYHIETRVPGLQWFLGGGLIGYNVFDGNKELRGAGLSFYPAAGVDFKFRGIPLDISGDFRPTFVVSQPNKNQYNDHNIGTVGVTVRYVLDRY